MGGKGEGAGVVVVVVVGEREGVWRGRRGSDVKATVVVALRSRGKRSSQQRRDRGMDSFMLEQCSCAVSSEARVRALYDVCKGSSSLTPKVMR